jgi:protein involved in polysaccharide export with SLBB domain
MGDYGSNTNSTTDAMRSYALDEKHLLEPGDQLFFQIIEDKMSPTNLVVTDSRELSMPYLGRVSVENKTCRKLAAELKLLLEKDYYYHATVVVGLNAVNKVSGRVLIWGEVHNQGPIDILASHTLTVGEAILRAGGITEHADMKRVKVVRNDGRGSTRVIEVNLAEVMEKGKTEKDITIEPNDYIIVPAKLIRF